MVVDLPAPSGQKAEELPALDAQVKMVDGREITEAADQLDGLDGRRRKRRR